MNPDGKREQDIAEGLEATLELALVFSKKLRSTRAVLTPEDSASAEKAKQGPRELRLSAELAVALIQNAELRTQLASACQCVCAHCLGEEVVTLDGDNG